MYQVFVLFETFLIIAYILFYFLLIGDIDDQLASPPGLMDDSLINGLLNGPMVSQSDWKTGKRFFFSFSLTENLFLKPTFSGRNQSLDD